MPESVTLVERETLLSTLNNQREHVLGILEGVPEGALRQSVLPSGWTPLGLIQHLALDVERFWFRVVMAGKSIDAAEYSAPSGWTVAPDVASEAVFDLYRREIELANAIIVETSLDTVPAGWPEGLFGSWRLRDLRELILHVITETAVHAGHLDVVRELIDGRQWLVLG
jgi:hypothetical protein